MVDRKKQDDKKVDLYVVLKVHKKKHLRRCVSLYLKYSSLAQSVEHAAVNRSVVGSSPTGGVFGNMKSDIKFNFLPGSMVKRLRHRPFTAVTGVQIPLESLPLRKQLNLVP